MNKHVPEELKNKVVYLILSSASKVSGTINIVTHLEQLGFKIVIIPTPNTRTAVGKLDLSQSSNLIIMEEKSFLIDNHSKQIIPKPDLIIVAPATFNTVSKIALGIADNNALTNIATAIASNIPVIVAPSYDTLWYHPLNQHYLNVLCNWGVYVAYPDLESDHITMAPVKKIIDSAQAMFKKVKFKSIRLNDTQELDTKLQSLRKLHLSDFIDVGKAAKADCGNSGANGCLSIRNGNWMLTTASGSHLSSLQYDDLILVDIEQSEKDSIIYWYGEKDPSSESPLFIELYKHLPTVKAIAHTHCKQLTYNKHLANYKTKNYIAYGEFENSQELLDIILLYNFAILRLHGELAVASSLTDAYKLIHEKLMLNKSSV